MKSRFLKSIVLLLLAIIVVAGVRPVSAAIIEHDYRPSEPLATTPWYEFYGLDNFEADTNYIKGMRPHHAGALSMSQDYLASPKKSSKRLQRLAKGIIQNQRFEIMMLDNVEDIIGAIDFDGAEAPEIRKVAALGLAQQERFSRWPIPSFVNSDGFVSEEDVRFAKAMIIHHEGALTMCNDYIDNPHSNNGYLELMCLDILRDQAQEIALMRDIIDGFDGDPDSVVVEAHMIHGMEGMVHDHMKHGHH